MIINTKKRITIYADSGRVSLKTIYKIACEHADAGNKAAAAKAINEYEQQLKADYNKKLSDIIKFRNKLKSYKTDSDYKKELLSD